MSRSADSRIFEVSNNDLSESETVRVSVDYICLTGNHSLIVWAWFRLFGEFLSIWPAYNQHRQHYFSFASDYLSQTFTCYCLMCPPGSQRSHHQDLSSCFSFSVVHRSANSRTFTNVHTDMDTQTHIHTHKHTDTQTHQHTMIRTLVQIQIFTCDQKVFYD